MREAAGSDASEGRGDARRRAIVAATLELLRDGGPGAVTHRAVARAADVPLGATTYYFSSKADLLEHALEQLAGEEVARLGALADALDLSGISEAERPAAVAAALAPALRAEHAMMLPKFGVYLEAARGSELRDATGRWMAAFRGLAVAALAEAGVRDAEDAAAILVAAIDGMIIHRLATSDEPIEEPVLRARLERLVRGLAST